MIGETIAHYRVLEKIGAGGMGEVYRAEDTRLGRQVAIKVLPDVFARDPERLARFAREARLLASLNHPHIAAIHGFEEDRGVRFLVLELAPGETLAQRLLRGPLPVEEALEVCRQTAEALEAAHERGVIHRDLKPANVKLTPEGQVKVLDFGLAKALAGEQTGSDPGESPTISDIASRQGVILGTAAYMSPEQARGKAVDKRADIWAFGCLLYELLTATRAFAADTVTDTLAASLTRDPNWALLPPNTAPTIRRLLERCLQKDPKRRLHDIADARLEIEEALAGPSSALGLAAPVALLHPARWQQALPWGAAGLLAIVAALLLLRPPPAQPPAVRALIQPPEGHYFGTYQLAFSPDGTRIAFRGWTLNRGGGSLWIQDLATGTAHEVPGTPDAYNYFWSPDSKWLGFSAGGKLQKVEAAGGPIITLVEQGATGNGTWSPDGSILYEGLWTLHRVAAAGGPVTDVTLAETQGWRVQYPVFLPDGRHFLFYRVPAGGAADQPGIYVGDLNTHRQEFVAAAQAPRSAFVAGWLLYSREGTLIAQPFDAGGLAPTGEPIPIAQVSDNAWSVSPAGTLAYFAGDAATSASELSELLWYSRNGKQEGRFDTTRPFQFVRLSPDGQRLAAEIRDDAAKNSDIWVFELQRGIGTRITSDKANESCPVWAPDGKRIVFNADAAGHGDLHVKAASGFGQEEVLLASASNKVPSDWSRDGRNIAYTDVGVGGGQIAVALWNTDEAKSHLLIDKSSGTPHNEMARFSPDGKWLAYQVGLPSGSGDVGKAGRRHEIFVVPFPSLAERWQVSRDGGEQPVWRPDGKELFWMSLNNKLMAASVTVKGNGLTFGAPVELFQTRAEITNCGGQYDVTPDGKRFLVNSRNSQIETAPQPLTIVTHWTALLRK